MRLILATRNEHKLRELEPLLAPHELEPLPADVVLPPEDGETFVANALGKARAAVAATGRPTVADDSGIEAAALDGRPGIYSARYAGVGASDAANLAKLLGELPADGDRGVTYVCALVAVLGDGRELVVEEHCEGTLTDAVAGDGGFGYDPAFVPVDGDGTRTMAQLSAVEKDAISHRGRAARALLERLKSAG